MRERIDRRTFTKTTTGAAAASLAFPHIVRSANKKKLRAAIIGVGGRAVWNIPMMKDEAIVALCDVDSGALSAAAKKYPGAKTYRDYREMFEHSDDFDAVIISTPDHHHYSASIRAIRAGKAVYCEKPLTWSVWESLHLAAEAEKHKVPTQMGNQGMAGYGWRIAYNYVKAGAIGDVKEVHSWTGSHGAWFTDGIRTPEGEDPVPKSLDWDLWLGAAPMRPFKGPRVYHPHRWRGWIDFGNGCLGDWSCHLMNAYYKILEPGFPVSVECLSQTGPAIDSYPKGKTIKWEFAADGDRPAFDSYWYDGTHRPPRMPGIEEGREVKGDGSYLVGTKGTCWIVGAHNNSALLVPEARRKEFGKPKELVPASRGHRQEFVMAAKGEIPYDAPLSHFGYAGKLTAVNLMGNIAARVKGKLLYDAKTQRFSNSDEANALLTRTPRDGWYVS
jgi:predicted dehydrogenase